DVKNPVRVLRALEIALLGGDAGARDLDALLDGPPRDVVAGATFVLVEPAAADGEAAIVRRAQQMFIDGIVDESVALAARLPAGHTLLGTIGTAEALRVAAGDIDVDSAVAMVVTRTRQYARRQRTWFRKEPWWQRVDPVGSVDDVIARMRRC
ncbi:MAG TPA: tRNA dimethylallyltransferase, partial [Myxococcota bacterium]